MVLDPVGMALAALIVALSLLNARTTIYAAVASLVFPATAVASLPALGGASITVPQIGFCALFLLTLTRRQSLARLSDALGREPACQALVLFGILGAASAVLLPRLFAGETQVFTLARVAETIIRVPLAPSSGNVTQALYLGSGIAAFLCVVALAPEPGLFRVFVRAFKLLVILHVGFALVDAVGKYATGANVIGFLHTASYTNLTDVEFSGLPRVTGTYPEASFFSVFSAGQIALCFALWRADPRQWSWGILLGLLVVLVILSTSSAGYVFLGIAGGGFALAVIREVAEGRLRRTTIMMLGAAGLGLALAIVLVLASESLLRAVADFFDTLLFSKLGSESGVERSSWNAQAITNLLETHGLGIGLGSARSSSWALSLLAQTGLFGTALFMAFIALVLRPLSTERAAATPPEHRAFFGAFRAYVIAAPIAASISWTLVDLGLAFHIAAGLAVCARSDRLLSSA